jgi:hypothetical protein
MPSPQAGGPVPARPEQHGLGLVVEVVGEGDAVGARRQPDLLEPQVPCGACGRLSSAGTQCEPADVNRKSEGRGEVLYPSRHVGTPGMNAVVRVGHDELEPWASRRRADEAMRENRPHLK